VVENSIESGLADRLARAVERLGGPVPVDLERLARALGTTDIVLTDMVEDGRTTWIAGQPKIELRADRTSTRNRFTLAHEIGHILISQDETVARRTGGLEHDDIEKLCDWIAASILMPRQWVNQYSHKAQFNLSLLRLVAHKADVSLSAAAVRLAEVSGRTCMLLRWQRGPSRWLVVGQAAVPLQYSGGLVATSETNAQFDSLPRRCDLWRELSLQADLVRLVGTAHVDRSSKSCLTLFTSLAPEPLERGRL
jgi:hypothetical protein